MDVHTIVIEGDEMSFKALSARNLSKAQPARVILFSQHSIVYNMPDSQRDIRMVQDPPRDGLKEREAFKLWFTRAEWVVYVPCDSVTWKSDTTF